MNRQIDCEIPQSVSSAEVATSGVVPVACDGPFEQFRATKVFPSLDGLRAFSIVAVIGFHVVRPQSALFVHGHLGVELFFAISGVLITTLLLRERDANGEISLHNFYVRRTLRIFPLYYAILGAYILATAMSERGTARGQIFFQNLPAYATYTSNCFVSMATGAGTTFYFAWSLATEEQFYLFWPSIVRFSRYRLVPVAAMLILMLVGEATRHAAHAGWANGHTLWVRIAGSVATPICLGCVAAYAIHHRRSFAVLYRVAGRSWSVPAAVFACTAAVELSLDRIVIALTMVFLVVATIIRRQHPLRWLLDNKLARHIGMVSYGMYLMHMLSYRVIQRLLSDRGGRWAAFLATLGLVIVAATLSFNLFERKIQGLKRRLERPKCTRQSTDS